MAQKIEVATLDIDVDAVIKKSSDYKKQIDALKKSQKELRDSGQGASRQFAEQDAKLQNLNKAYRDNRKFAASLLSVNEDFERTLSAENKGVLELTDNRRQLREVVKQLSGDSKEEIELRDRLNNAIDEQTKAIRAQSSDFDASKDRIGEYKQSIEEAIPANSLLGGAINDIKSALNIVNPIYKAYSGEVKSSVSGILNATKGTEGLTRAQKAQAVAQNIVVNGLRLLKVALISTGIGAIVVALGSLVAFLAGTQEGIDKVNRVLKPMQVLFSRLLGVAQKLGKQLFEAFSNPRESLNKLVDLIKNNLEVRMNAFFSILQRIKNFDFDGIGEDLTRAATGIENLGEKSAAFFGQARDFLNESIDLGTQLANLQVEIEKGENALIIKRSELQRLIKEQNKIAEDVTKSQQERERAAIATVKASEELLSLEQILLDQRIKAKEIELSLNDTNREDQKELNELIAERNEKETQALELQTTQQNKLNTIRREIASQAEKAAQERAAAEREAALKSVRAANTELEIFKEKNAAILESDQELSQARIRAVLDAERYIRDESLAILEERLSEGLIKEDEANLERLKLQRTYREREAELNEQFRAEAEAAREELEEQERERKQAEEEARLELRELQAEDELEFRQLQLDRQREQEIANAEQLGADTTAIKEKYKILQDEIDRDRRIYNVEQAQQSFGQFSQLAKGFFGENKALSASLALADTFLSAQKAYASQLIPGDPTSIGRAVLAAAAASAAGLRNVAGIRNTTFAEGGILQGPSHAMGGIKTPYGELEGGEAVINTRSTKMFKPILSLLNAAGGGKKFASGGILGSSLATTQSGFSSASIMRQFNGGIDYDKLAMAVKNGYASAPPPITDIRDFHEVNDKVNNVVNGANV